MPQSSEFQRRYREFNAIWSDCYIGYAYGSIGNVPPSQEVAVQWFGENPGFTGFASSGHSETLHVTEQSLHVVSPAEGVELLETMIVQAVHYGSNERLPAGEALRLAKLFLAGFESPLVLSNFRVSESSSGSYVGGHNPVVSGNGYSCEALVCCLDRQHIGYLLSIDNE